MKKGLLKIWTVVAVLAALAAAGCDDDGEGTPSDSVSVKIEELEVSATGISFRITPRNAERVVWACRPATEGLLTAEELLVEGTPADAHEASEQEAERLSPETDYLVQAVATAGKRVSKMAFLEVATSRIELTDAPGPGVYQFEAGSDKSSRYAFTLAAGPTAEGLEGKIVAAGPDAYVFNIEIYAAASENPNSPRIPEGTYTFDGDPLQGGGRTEGSANPAASSFSYWDSTTGAATDDYPAAGGTVKVEHTDAGYAVTLSVDEHFGSDEFGSRHFTARFEGEIPMKWNLGYDAIPEPVDTKFTHVEAVYMGDYLTPGHDNFLLDFYDGTPDNEGNLSDGNLLHVDLYMPVIEDRSQLYLKEGTYIFDYETSDIYMGRGSILDFFGTPTVFGTSWRTIDPEEGQRLGLVTGGTLEVDHVAEFYYNLKFDFLTAEGVSLTATYSGNIEPRDEAPDRPTSPFTEDYHVDCGPNAKGKMTWWGDDYDGTTTATGFLYLRNPETLEGALFNLNMPLDAGFTLPEGTYTVAPEGDNNTDFTYRPGKMDGSQAHGSYGYVHYQYVDSDNMDRLAPALGGEITIKKEGDEYVINWALTDDAYEPNTITGDFRGKIELVDWSMPWAVSVPTYTPQGPRLARSQEALERIVAVRGIK